MTRWWRAWGLSGTGGGRRYWEVAAIVLFLGGCASVDPTIVPYPCDRLDPAERRQITQLRQMPGDPYRRLRWYALDADESCAGNQALGAPPLTKTPERKPRPWWKRWPWEWWA